MAEERKLVSVLFADIVGSTAFGHENDPEVVRAVFGRYFDQARELIELHGGSVEKYIGDAVMAVFGVPRVHDDDAERSVRAGLAIRDAMTTLNEELALELSARIGINSGEAVAAVDARDQRLVTGDVVNVAARLQQRAEPGEVLAGALTEQLTREAIEFEPIAAAMVHGKPEPIAAFRAVRPRSAQPEQARGLPHMRARLVGRVRELTLLTDAFERAKSDRRGQLFTIVGNAGVGKSRLVGEFLARAGGGEVRALRGRCLPYGVGITYWPLAELVVSDLGVNRQQNRADLLARLDGRLQMLASPSLRAAARSRLTVLLGLAEASEVLPDVANDRLPAELGWAVGEYMRAASSERPTIAVIDDVQWAEPAALAIVGELVEATAESPFLLLCIARPELLERNRDWSAGIANATTILLEPLNEDETRTLIARLLDVDDMPEQLRAAIVARSGGNPLFCEEFVRMLIDEGRIVRHGDRWRGATAESFAVRVPESIHALLSARLDSLDSGHKAVVQAASVIGEQFDAEQLSRLADRDVADDLRSLARSGFVLADRSAGANGYRFKHLLIHDVAYASLPKAERARLHEAFGIAVEADAGDRREPLIEIIAYHAQQAFALSMELRQSGPALVARATRAFELGVEGGRRALERGNGPALASFIETARLAQTATTLPPAMVLGLELLDAQAAGFRGDYIVARLQLTAAGDLARSVGRSDLEADAALALADVLVLAGADDDLPIIDAALERAGRLYGELGDGKGRLRAQMVGLERLFQIGQMGPMLERGLSLVDEALAAGERAVAATALARLISPAIWTGRTQLAEQLADRADALTAELGLLASARMARFFRARLDWVRRDLAKAEAALQALLADAQAAGDGQFIIAIERLVAETMAADERFADAEAHVDQAIALSQSTGERWSRTELLCWKAVLADRRGDQTEADQTLAEARETLRDIDYAANSTYFAALASIQARRGRDDEAEASFHRSLDVVHDSDNWSWVMTTLDLAEFLIDRQRYVEAAPMVADVDAAIAGTELNICRPQLERLQARLATKSAAPTG